MSSGTNSERITQNNTIITGNNADLDALKTRIQNLPTRAVTQTKSVTITENGTTTIEPDTGYDGLSEVEIDVDVQDTNNAKVNGSLPYNANEGIKSLIEEIDMKGIILNKMSNAFFKWYNLSKIKNLDTSNVDDFGSAFRECKNLETIPEIDTKNGRDFLSCFAYSSNLKNIGVLNFYSLQSANKLQGMFAGCPLLTNVTLNNILISCTSLRYSTGTKTLKYLGLTQAQAETCQTLSNWDAFVAAGWTTGY